MTGALGKTARLRTSFAAAWRALPLIDYDILSQWTEDLSDDQIRDILERIPKDGSTDAMAIQAAIEADDRVRARRSSHRLKGMAAGIGAARLSEIARTIEILAQTPDDLSGHAGELALVLEETLTELSTLQI